VLVRLAVRDDAGQARRALKALSAAEVIAVSTAALCELVWVLRSAYEFSPQEIMAAIAPLIHAGNVVVDSVAVEAGMKMLQHGGDFADGVIALDGARLGGEIFLSFDKKAVSCATGLGRSARFVE
jgi:predicted nucleic-acid-binding protein